MPSQASYTVDQPRNLTEKQARAITDIINTAYYFGEQSIWQEHTQRTNPEEILQFSKCGELFVALNGNDDILGAVRLRKLNDQIAEFGLLGTHREHLKKGIGSLLIDTIERYASDELHCCIMQLEILDPAHATHMEKEFLKSWYSKLGYQFERNGSINDDYPHLAPQLAQPCHYLIYQKKLD